MSFQIKKVGDWARASHALKFLAFNLTPIFTGAMYDNGEFILERMKGHIASQDLGWSPLSQKTVELKNGDSTIYVDTGFLYENLEVIRVSGLGGNVSVFVGASAAKTSPSGENFAELMGWLEYGTANMPGRPLLGPTWEEVQNPVKLALKEVMRTLIRGL